MKGIKIEAFSCSLVGSALCRFKISIYVK